MNPISTQFSTVSSSISTLHSAIKDKLPLEEIRRYFNPRSLNEKIDGMLPLDLAILNNDEELIVALISAGGKFKDNLEAFMTFCSEGNLVIAQAYINKGRIDKAKYLPLALTVATNFDQKEMVRLLLQSGANPSVRDADGFTPAHGACELGYYEILKVFIEEGRVDINDQSNPNRFTFLMNAVIHGKKDVVNWLLEKGANPQLYCSNGFTAFYMACEEDLNIVQRLYEVSEAGSTQSFFNIQYGPHQHNPLHCASRKGKLDIVKWLLKQGADPLAEDQKGFTPWHNACMVGFMDIIQAFYDIGKIDLNKKFNKLVNSTILHFCASNSSPAVIRWLLDKGADSSMIDEEISPLEIAFREGVDGNIRAFIDKDFRNINQVYSNNKYTAISLAVIHENYPIVKWLLDNGADPLIPNAHEFDSFFLACKTGNLPIAQLFYEHSKSPKTNFKLDLNKKYSNAEVTPLSFASLNRRADVVQWLLRIGANPSLVDTAGYSLFCALCEQGNLDLAKILYAAGQNVPPDQMRIDVNQQYSKDERTALHIATHNQRAHVVEWLLANDADPYIKDKAGRTPFDWALEDKNPETIKAYTHLLIGKIDDKILPFIEFLLKNSALIPNLEHLPIDANSPVSFKLLGICSHFINWVIKQDSKSIPEKIEELIALDVDDKLVPLKDTKLTSNLGQELLDHFIPLLYKHFPQLKSKKPGLISVNKEIFRVIREVLFKFKWMCDIQYNDNIKLKVKSETSLEKLFEFIITLNNTLQQQRAIIASGNTNDTVAVAAKPETKVAPKPIEPSPQIKPAKPQHSSSSPSVNVPTTQKKPVKNKKRKGKQKQKGSAPNVTAATHQKEHPSQVIVAADIPLPPLFPPQIIPLKTPSFDLESLLVDSSQPHKQDHQLSELKKILSSPELLHLSLFDEVCKINRNHHQVPGFFAFDSWLIHSSHKIFHSDVMCDLFLQFVREGYQDPFKPEQLLESFSTKHFIDELSKQEGDRKQTIRNMIKILPSLSSRHAISAAILIIGEQTARLTDELSDIIDICMKYKVYRNLRHRLENQPEAVPFEREGVIEEGLINPGIDWDEMLNELINELPADLEKLKNSKIMKE